MFTLSNKKAAVNRKNTYKDKGLKIKTL